MATTIIKNAAISGALAGILSGRAPTFSNPAASEPVLDANVAEAFGNQVLTANAALSAPMADADNVSIDLVVFAASLAVFSDRAPRSTTATDYATQAAAAVAAAKAAVAKLGTP